MGPRMDDTMRVACLTLMRHAKPTLSLVPSLLQDRQFRGRFTQRTRQPTSHGYQPAGDAHLQRSKNRELHCGQRTVAERTKAATKSRARAHRPTPPLLLGSRWCPEAPRVIDGHGWTRQRHRAIGVLHICSTGTDESRSGVGGVDLPEALRARPAA
jgi:hypothetical protein